jgi:thymidine phosphorylase
LIVASILSKKFASGTEAVVFDVKRGGGAFMRTEEEARALARELVDVSHELSRRGYAVITSMEQPLGRAIGNANETAEAFALLQGQAPPDLMEVTRELAVRMLLIAKIARERFEAEARLDRVLESGEAVRRAEAWIQAQGGDPRSLHDPSILPHADVETPVLAPRSGYVTSIDARALGTLLVAMRGGRARKEDPVDPAVGIRLLAKRGDAVREGEAMAIVEAHRSAPEWADSAQRAFTIGDAAPAREPVILEEVR